MYAPLIPTGPEAHDAGTLTRTPGRLILASFAGGVLLALATFVQPAEADFFVGAAENTSGGTSASDPIVYPIRINCSADPSTMSVNLNMAAEVGKWYAFHVLRDATASVSRCNVDGFDSMSASLNTSAGGSGSAFSGVKASDFTIRDVNDGVARALAVNESAAVAFQMPADASWVSLTLSFGPNWAGSGPFMPVSFYIRTPVGGPSAPSSSSAPDPRAGTVSVVAEQVAASGVEGSAGGVRVRGSEVLPVTSRVSGSVGPRGGVVLDSDGMQVRVASVLGARADAGVIVPSSGVFEASVTGPLVPGSVVEVWINSEPRLVAAAEVPEDGDSVTVAIPTGTPLDGGDPIEDGEHTLELRMFTEDGYEIVATGITVGQVAPTRVPAGEGPAPLGGVLPLLAGALLVAAVAGRRVLVRG